MLLLKNARNAAKNYLLLNFSEIKRRKMGYSIIVKSAKMKY